MIGSRPAPSLPDMKGPGEFSVPNGRTEALQRGSANDRIIASWSRFGPYLVSTSPDPGVPPLCPGRRVFAQRRALPRLVVPGIPLFRPHLVVPARRARPSAAAVYRLSTGIPAVDGTHVVATELVARPAGVFRADVRAPRNLRATRSLGAATRERRQRLAFRGLARSLLLHRAPMGHGGHRHHRTGGAGRSARPRGLGGCGSHCRHVAEALSRRLHRGRGRRAHPRPTLSIGGGHESLLRRRDHGDQSPRGDAEHRRVEFLLPLESRPFGRLWDLGALAGVFLPTISLAGVPWPRSPEASPSLRWCSVHGDRS